MNTNERAETHACDLISRQAAIDALDNNPRYYDGKDCIEQNWDDRQTIASLPSAQSDWYEMLVICDNCGHAIHVKRLQENAESGVKSDD